MMKKIVMILTSIIAGMGIGAGGTAKILSAPLNRNAANADKFQNYFMLMNKWLKIKQDGKNLSEYFVSKGYHAIAIYGMGDIGESLVNEIRNSGIDIKYGIDQNAKKNDSDGLPILQLNDELPNVDVVIVTPVYYYENIEYILCNRVKCPVISLEEVLDMVNEKAFDT